MDGRQLAALCLLCAGCADDPVLAPEGSADSTEESSDATSTSDSTDSESTDSEFGADSCAEFVTEETCKAVQPEPLGANCHWVSVRVISDVASCTLATQERCLAAQGGNLGCFTTGCGDVVSQLWYREVDGATEVLKSDRICEYELFDDPPWLECGNHQGWQDPACACACE